METFDFDLFVIGAGSGGLAAAKRAAGHGARVAIAESGRVGGTCVIRGCVPKKIMVYASQLGVARTLAADFGWAASPTDFAWERLCHVRDGVVNNLELAHQRYLAAAGVQLFAERATVAAPQRVTVDGRHFTARHLLLATGATPVMPAFSGSTDGLVSDDFFKLKSMPRSIVLVGGGYIAVEFACLMASFGARTTLLARTHVLRGFDQDLRVGMREAMQRRGIDVREATFVQRLERSGGLTTLEVASQRGTDRLEADCCVVFAIGRRPNSAGLGLAEAGVRLHAETGAVEVNEHHQSTTPSIHAVGDVIDRANLTPVAIKAGRMLADRLFAGGTATLPYDSIPTAVFGSPPIGTVGLTEEAARQRFGEAVKVFKTRFIPLMYSATPQERKHASILKLVVDGRNDRVLGCHMLGEDAPEIIQGFAAAMTAGVTKAQLDATLAVHPTQAEEFVLMR